MKYRYYIASVFDGAVYGTNDPKVADNHRGIEEDFVIDTQEAEWLVFGGVVPIPEKSE